MGFGKTASVVASVGAAGYTAQQAFCSAPATSHRAAVSDTPVLRGSSDAQSGDAAWSGSSASAAVPAAALAFAAAGVAAKRRAGGRPKRGSLVAVGDGSSWGSLSGDASSSLDTTGPIPFVKLKRGNDEAIVYTLGATVTSYKTSGTEWLAVRPDAKLDGSKPISGGLPFCFPQFGPGSIQQHGFARNLTWKLLDDATEAGTCIMELTDNEETRAMWPHNFRAEYKVELLEGKLATTFTVENVSNSAFDFTAALHSYYGVGSVDTCKITGDFKGATKIDKTIDSGKLCRGESDEVTISKFTEEIYKEVLPGKVVLEDPSKGSLAIQSGGGWRDVVIWNPYGDANMGASGFVCVESAELASVPLAPKATWVATMDLVPSPN